MASWSFRDEAEAARFYGRVKDLAQKGDCQSIWSEEETVTLSPEPQKARVLRPGETPPAPPALHYQRADDYFFCAAVGVLRLRKMYDGAGYREGVNHLVDVAIDNSSV